jgi:hypothetical protein
VAATFESIRCRLDDLLASVVEEVELGVLDAKVAEPVMKALDRTLSAEAECMQGVEKAAKSRLNLAQRSLTWFAHRLRSLNARKSVPDAGRVPLVEKADAIRDDVRTLRRVLVCDGAEEAQAR